MRPKTNNMLYLNVFFIVARYVRHGNANRECDFSLGLGTYKTTYNIKISQGRKTSQLHNTLIFNDFFSTQAGEDFKNL